MPIRQDFVVELPNNIKTQVENFVATCLEEFSSKEFNQKVNALNLENQLASSLTINKSEKNIVRNKFASFDFHVINDSIQLIECSIFPAGLSFAVSEIMHPSISIQYLNAINELFEPYNKILIIDHDLKNQIFLAEFFWLKHHLQQQGKQVHITEASELSYDLETNTVTCGPELLLSGEFQSVNLDSQIDFIANRLPLGDALETPEKFQALFDCQLSNPELFSTTYYEWMLSEKSSLPILAENPSLAKYLGNPSLAKSYQNIEQVKKVYGSKVVAKPLYSRGGKGVMIKPSNPQLKSVLNAEEEYLFQRYAPAPKLPTGEKYDLRAYVLNGEVEGYLARLFFGAVTNFKSNDSGHCQVKFI